MPSITNVGEAVDAICDDCLFFVGGEYIRPSGIVRVTFGENPDKAGEVVPSFVTSDGSTVRHDPTLGGDVGDLLAEALCYIERGGNDSVRFEDPFFTGALAIFRKDNKAVQFRSVFPPYGIIGTVVFGGGATIRNARYDKVGNRLLFYKDNSGVRGLPLDGSTGAPVVFDMNITSSFGGDKAFAPDNETGKIYHVRKDGSGDTSFSVADNDGSNITQLIAPGATPWNPNKKATNSMWCDGESGYVFATLSVSSGAENLIRYDIEAGTAKIINQADQNGQSAAFDEGGDLDRVNKKLYLVSDRKVFIYDYEGNFIANKDIEESNFGVGDVAVNPRQFNEVTGITVGRPTANTGSVEDRVTLYDKDFNKKKDVDLGSFLYNTTAGFKYVNGLNL